MRKAKRIIDLLTFWPSCKPGKVNTQYSVLDVDIVEVGYITFLMYRILSFVMIGVVRSQTTLIPAVTTITVRENVTTTTPIMPSTTTSVCSIFNTSSCEACAPGTYYNNGGYSLFGLHQLCRDLVVVSVI